MERLNREWFERAQRRARAYGEPAAVVILDADDGETVAELYVRASTRDDAKRRILARVPGATFYR